VRVAQGQVWCLLANYPNDPDGFDQGQRCAETGAGDEGDDEDGENRYRENKKSGERKIEGAGPQLLNFLFRHHSSDSSIRPNPEGPHLRFLDYVGFLCRCFSVFEEKQFRR
jgi:hypothetical protein